MAKKVVVREGKESETAKDMERKGSFSLPAWGCCAWNPREESEGVHNKHE